jgi:hypothetical protein
VEVSIGRTSVMGRVVWRKGEQFGFHSRSTIDKDCLLSGRCEVQEGHRSRSTDRLSVGPDRERDYRLMSRAIQFIAGIAFALGGCAAIALLLHEMLPTLIQALSAHLSP